MLRPAATLARLEAMRAKAEHQHDQCVGRLTTTAAQIIGFEASRAKSVGEAAALHDIGKLTLPDSILQNPGRLSDGEMELMKMHAKYGHELLSVNQDPLLALAATIALHHHERADGSGYPDGLRAEDTEIEARLVAVVDSYAAMREPRAYKRSMTHEEVVEILTRGNGRTKPAHFDVDILRAFLAAADEIAEAYKEAFDLFTR